VGTTSGGAAEGAGSLAWELACVCTARELAQEWGFGAGICTVVEVSAEKNRISAVEYRIVF